MIYNIITIFKEIGLDGYSAIIAGRSNKNQIHYEIFCDYI